jgi:hypothetical protein
MSKAGTQGLLHLNNTKCHPCRNIFKDETAQQWRQHGSTDMQPAMWLKSYEQNINQYPDFKILKHGTYIINNTGNF